MIDYKSMEWNMFEALKEAEIASKKDEVPVGAVIVSSNGDIVAKAHNLKESTNDPCGHAEILAIKEACTKVGDWRLNDHSLIVTLEPCPMCISAIMNARIKNLIFGAYDPKSGSLSKGLYFAQDKSFNHKVNVVGGVKHFECAKLLSNFFKNKRSKYSQKNK